MGKTQSNIESFSGYIHAIEKKLAQGNATEHTHRAALQAFLEGFAAGITATNEPKHIDCGAPDFVIRKGATTIGYIEAKDIGISLDNIEKSDQLKRYLNALTNLILTDYLEFRWYVDGKERLSARLGTPTKDSKIKRDKEGIQVVTKLLIAFLEHQAERVGTPQELAERMARLAHMIRDLIINAFKQEAESGGLHNQLAAFQANLIPDLSVEQFADMYAQTIAYGLFAARCNAPDNKDFTRQNATYLLPKTNPFLRKLFNTIAGPELDDRIAWLVDDLAQILAQADMAAVLENFGKHSGKEDPVVHFYETFLKAYDPKVREMRGVYYTPEPVVSYIVRSIDGLLKDCFNKPQGLADPDVYILDPATGTATFLYMIINEIHQAFTGQEGMWNDYVAEKLLPRLFGFELLMAPYAVAHLKMGILLKETGYQSESEQRLGIYLTNTLDEAIQHSETIFDRWITDEANEAAEVKKEKPIMVVLGNPPYSGHSANRSKKEYELKAGQTYLDKLILQKSSEGEKVRWWEIWKTTKKDETRSLLTFIGRLIEDYKIIDDQLLDEKNPKMIQDDYVKFIRFGQWRIEQTGQGILGFITNHSYIDNPTFRGMRQSLMNTFTDIYILNLHGNIKKKEVAPDGGKDENVFDIQQGVAISLLVKEPDNIGPARVHYTDLWGLREGKHQTLFQTDVNDTDWVELQPHSPYYLFLPRGEAQLDEYNKGWKVTEVFPINNVGIVTHRDHFVFDFDRMKLKDRFINFKETVLSNDEIRDKYDLEDKQDWNVNNARSDIRKEIDWEKYFYDCLYRPFDSRHIFYHKAVINRPRSEIMFHMLNGNNIGLCTNRQVIGDFRHVLCSRKVIDNSTVSSQTKERTYLFPLYLYPIVNKEQEDKSSGKEGGTQAAMAIQEKREPNLNPAFVKEFSEKLDLQFVEDDRGDLESTFGPEDIFNYTYAVFHSPTYRTRYAEFLKIDFPRLPLTSDKALFKALTEKGAESVSLHLMESPTLNTPITKYPVSGSNEVEKVTYDEKTHRVYINKEQYFEGVPPEVWEFHIGGYQVCHKWLKDRQKAHRTLTYDDLAHYQKVVVALKETIRLMAEIDKLIPGWPMG